MSNLLAAPVLMPAQQPVGGGMPSSLAAALMGHNVPVSLPSLGGSMPLGSIENLLLMQKMNDPSGNRQSLASQLWHGFGNLANGYDWGGMAGQGMLNGLSADAAANIAGGAAGL